MKIKFLGATGSVTGSKYLIQHGRKQIMVDCGLFQGLKDLRLRNWSDLPVNVHDLDCIILTHAHIDHSGYIPRLVNQGFRGKIYCTRGTRDLCKILLPDCGYLQEEEAKYANKRGYSKHKPALPLFTFDDAHDSLRFFRGVDYEKSFDLGDGLKLRFRDAGHILGSSGVTISNGQKSIHFSGDLGRSNDPILHPPAVPDGVDYLVVESTYGNRVHPESNPLDELEDIIKSTVARKGVIVVPAFAVGRTQSLLYYISELRKTNRIPEIPIYLNSPMATNVTGLYCDHHSNHKLSPRQCHAMCNVAAYVTSSEESKRLNMKDGPMLIVSASGMATGGRVIHHVKAFGPDEKNTILFTGFQAAGTRGEKIVNGCESVKIHGREIPIQAEVKNLESLSAHADSNELVGWMKKFKKAPRKVFVTHGEPTAAAALGNRIKEELRWNVLVPQYLDELEIE